MSARIIPGTFLILTMLVCGACETPRSAPATTVKKTACSGQPQQVSAPALLDAPARYKGSYVEASGVAYTTTGTRKTVAGARRWAKGEAPQETDCLTRQWLTPPGEYTTLTRRIDLSDASGVIFCPTRSCDAKAAAATCPLAADKPVKVRGIFRYDEGLMLATLEQCSR